MTHSPSMSWFLRSLDPSPDCPICYSPYSLTSGHFPERLGCGHWLCKICLLAHIDISPNGLQCPECRAPILGALGREEQIADLDSDLWEDGTMTDSDTESEFGLSINSELEDPDDEDYDERGVVENCGCPACNPDSSDTESDTDSEPSSDTENEAEAGGCPSDSDSDSASNSDNDEYSERGIECDCSACSWERDSRSSSDSDSDRHADDELGSD